MDSRLIAEPAIAPRFARDPLAIPRNDGRGKFSFAFNLIWVVQSLAQKYSCSLLTQITCISFAIPAHTKGRFAIVTDVGQGCDGRGRRC